MPAAELNHLTGRIGELYAAMITRGQLALASKQRGYDVVAATGERISVKTVTSSSHVNLRESTFALVDRVMVLRLRVEEGDLAIEEIPDCPAVEARARCRPGAGAFVLAIPPAVRTAPAERGLVAAEATFEDLRILQYESGAIGLERSGAAVAPVRPVLREIAARIGVDPLNGTGTPKNTRVLGGDLVKSLNARGGVTPGL